MCVKGWNWGTAKFSGKFFRITALIMSEILMMISEVKINSQFKISLLFNINSESSEDEVSCFSPNCLVSAFHRATVILRSQWQHSVWDPTVQRFPVCHREERSHSGVSPEWRHRSLPYGGPILRPTQSVWWTARPRGGDKGCFTSAFLFVCFSLFLFTVVLKLCVFIQAFAQNVLSKADVIQATGDAVCIFKELQCLTPRGR